jgi:hypothetical protein
MRKPRSKSLLIKFHFPIHDSTRAKKKGYKIPPILVTPFFGAETQNRTGDTRIFSPLLYRLSYLGIVGTAGKL